MSITKPQLRFFDRKVMDFYHKAGREHLLWRKEGITAYEVWVSEIMLQQTQVSRVIEYYEKFLKRFPTVEDLAKATWEEFLPYYAGLGYYRRGRNMLETAKQVVGEHRGEFPRDKKQLMKLPGVGEYTASAILSFAYGDNHLAWDTNLYRVIGRFFFGKKDALKKNHAFEKQTPPLEFFEQRFQSSKRDLNAALMDFGSVICISKPKCNICPLVKQCCYFQEGGRQELGVKRAQGGFPIKEAQVYVWLHENHKTYYSSRKDCFEPFVLPPEYNSREGIKAYFREHYGLELSVRPPHQKVYLDDIPTLLVNAQILLGEPRFVVFTQSDAKAFNATLPKKTPTS
jgi:A/G-specific adenine glycosylase